MHISKIFALITITTLFLAQCANKAEKPSEGAQATDTAPATEAPAAATTENSEVRIPPAPPLDQNQINQGVMACDRMASIVNDQLLEKEYDLSKNPGDQALANTVAKLKEYQVGFSQMKGRIQAANAETWPAIFKEYQVLGVEAKAFLKPLVMGEQPK